MSVQRTFGELLSEARLERKLSLRKAAEDLNVSHVYLSEVERGARAPMTSDRWPDIERVYGISHEQLRQAAEQSRSVKMELRNAPPAYRDLGFALARRIEKKNLSQKQMRELMDILGDDDE